MQWIRPGDADYDGRRALFNAMIDKRPRSIAACSTAADVRAALERARADGQAVAGQSSNDDGLMIDVRAMKSIEIDPAARTARVGAGCTWGEFDAAAQVHGLATTGGRVSTTGVSVLTLGGGSGWLERKHALSCDNLVAVELVTAVGRELRADDQQHPELLWACKGGGGNFGVVTAMEFKLHPVGPLILGGLLAWPADRGPEVARRHHPHRLRVRVNQLVGAAVGLHPDVDVLGETLPVQQVPRNWATTSLHTATVLVADPSPSHPGVPVGRSGAGGGRPGSSGRLGGRGAGRHRRPDPTGAGADQRGVRRRPARVDEQPERAGWPRVIALAQPRICLL